ncbi:MAG: DNA-directed DNA polymerase [Peltula sp. TS41687]|nr:MAG: DNA-directed DNA polymerase [Peltula sp. TS41687]
MSPDDFAPLRPHFEGLTSDDEQTRLEASYAILAGLEDKSAETCHKVLERLLKGLASGRKSARIGFSVTLTELLIRLFGPDGANGSQNDLGFPRVMELLHTHTQVTGNVPGQEERDHYLGRLFGLQAILAATVVRYHQNSKAQWKQLLDAIFELARKKSWLREECGWIVYKTLQDSQGSPWGKDLAEVAIDRICASQVARTPEGVAIWLAARSLHPDLLLPEQPWRHQDPLYVKNSTALAQVMRESSSGSGSQGDREDLKLQPKGMWSSRPNFAWTVILKELYAISSKKKRLSFGSFWQEVVDGLLCQCHFTLQGYPADSLPENLFSASASQERKHWGFMLLAIAVQETPRELILAAFSRNLVRCLINQLRDGERYLHRTALKCLKVMQARVERDPETAYEFVFGLTGACGSPLFDGLTKTKTVSTLVATANDVALQRITSMFDRIIQQPLSNETKLTEWHRRALADHLVSAVRSHKLEGSNSWVISVLTLFAKYAYLKPKDSQFEPIPPLSSTSRDMFKAKLSACFAHLMTVKTSFHMNWPFKIIHYLKSEEESGRFDMFMDLDSGIEKVRKSAWKKINRLNKMEKSVDERKVAYLRALKLLYSLVMIQLYNGESDALSVLMDLSVLCDNMQGKNDEGDHNATEVLVELLLGLVSKPSALLRKLAQQVFGALTSELTHSGLQLLFDVLNSKESLAGQQELFEQNPGSDEESEVNNGATMEGNSDASSNGSDSDDVMVDVQEGKQDKTKEDEHGSESDDDHSDDSKTDSEDNVSDTNEEDDEIAKFNAALAGIVGTRQYDQNMTNEDGSSDDDEEDMDDEQMFALDDQMAKIFKERKKITSKKQQNKDAKSNMIDFKNKVLDLLEIYIKKEYSNPLSLALPLPLLTLVRSTTSKQIASRACNLIRDLTQKCKGKETTLLQDPGAAWKLLRDVHGEATKDASRAHATACSQSSLMIVKVLVNSDRGNIKDVVTIYGETQTKWLLGKCRVQPLLFSDFINWSTSFSKQS